MPVLLVTIYKYEFISSKIDSFYSQTVDVRAVFESILKSEQQRIRTSYASSDLLIPLVEIIRTLDYHAFILSHDIGVKNQELIFQKYRYGWGLAFRKFYEEYELLPSSCKWSLWIPRAPWRSPECFFQHQIP